MNRTDHQAELEDMVLWCETTIAVGGRFPTPNELVNAFGRGQYTLVRRICEAERKDLLVRLVRAMVLGGHTPGLAEWYVLDAIAGLRHTRTLEWWPTLAELRKITRAAVAELHGLRVPHSPRRMKADAR